MDGVIPSIGLVVIALSVLVFAIKRCQQILSSPLNVAKDAHWSVKFSGIWLWWHQVREQDTVAVHDAHMRLGPVVRLGPRELSINDYEGGLKPIYEGRLPKTEFYDAANSYGEAPMVALKDEESHRRRIRMLAKPYGKTYLKNQLDWQVEQCRLVQDLVFGVEKLIEKHSTVEFYDVFFAWSVASISTYVFGARAAYNLLHNIPEAGAIRDAYFSQRAYVFISTFLPIPTKWLEWMGYHPEISWFRTMQDKSADPLQLSEHEATGRTAPYNYMKQSMNGLTPNGSIDKSYMSAKDSAILSSEMQDHIVAGIDTSSAMLVSCAYLLSLEHNRHWQERIREEILSKSHLMQQDDLEQLPILNAIIKETLRFCPPVAGALPRITDKTVVMGPQGQEVTVPPGITVHCQARSLHQSNVFGSPQTFDPERWLTSNIEKRREMDRWFWAFGSGSRRCIGEHLGMSNLRAALAAIYGNFETRWTAETMLNTSHGMLAMPLPNNHGNYMLLHVNKVD